MISLSQLSACANPAHVHSMRGTVFRPDFPGSGKRLGTTGNHVGSSDDAENWLVDHNGERKAVAQKKYEGAAGLQTKMKKMQAL